MTKLGLILFFFLALTGDTVWAGLSIKVEKNMMDYELRVGTPFFFEDEAWQVETFLERLEKLGLVKRDSTGKIGGENAAWAGHRGPVTRISALTIEAVGLLLDHAGSLLGKSNKELMNDELYGHLPWWLESIWIPVDFPLIIPEDHLFMGSLDKLCQALETIRTLSPYALGTIPPGYEKMRADPDSPWDDELDWPKDQLEIRCIQWAWLAFYQAATEALAQNTAFVGNGI